MQFIISTDRGTGQDYPFSPTRKRVRVLHNSFGSIRQPEQMNEDRAFQFGWQKGITVIRNGQTTLYETALLCKLRVSLLLK